MRSILVINTSKNENSIIEMSHLINSIRKDNPHTEISVLTSSEHEDYANILEGVTKSFLINIKKINQILNSPIYCDAFAINEIYTSLNECTQKNWDSVINYDNSNLSAVLTGMLETNQFHGTQINNHLVAKTSNKWATFRNYVAANLSRPTHDLLTINHHILNVVPSYESLKIKIKNDYLMVANQNFNKIRQKESLRKPSAKIIGISLYKPSMGMQDISQLVSSLLQSDSYLPVLIHTGSASEKEWVNKINLENGNQLISIIAEAYSISAVLANVDCLVTSNNIHLKIADAIDTRIIEVRDNQRGINISTYNSGNYLIPTNERTVHAIEYALDHLYGLANQNIAQEIAAPVYLNQFDDYGIFLTQVAGPINVNQELRYHIERYYNYLLMGYKENNKHLQNIKDSLDENIIEFFTEEVKESTTRIVKHLLSTLRSLQTAKSNRQSLDSFITNLDRLILLGNEDTILKTALKLFEGEIENIAADADPIREFEKSLYNLKNNIQEMTGIISTLISEESSVEKGKITLDT
jgi:hypothetical protein